MNIARGGIFLPRGPEAMGTQGSWGNLQSLSRAPEPGPEAMGTLKSPQKIL